MEQRIKTATKKGTGQSTPTEIEKFVDAPGRKELVAQVRKKIDDTVKANNVVLYMKGTKNFPQCGFSARVVQALTTVGEPFVDVNVLADPEIRDGVKEYSNWPTIPQLYVKGEFVGGCDIVTELASSGELEKLLKG